MDMNFEKSWKDLDDDFSQGARVNYMKLQAGKNVCRIASNPSKIMLHWEKDILGKSHKIVCTGDSSCPLCKLGHAPSTRYQMKVIDKTNGEAEAKMLEVGATIIRQLLGFVNDEDYGDPKTYDVKIQKEGSGRETRYTVTASPRKNEITPSEQEMIDQLPSPSDINKVMTKDQIMELNLSCFGNSSNEDDLERPEKKEEPKKNSAMDDWEQL